MTLLAFHFVEELQNITNSLNDIPGHWRVLLCETSLEMHPGCSTENRRDLCPSGVLAVGPPSPRAPPHRLQRPRSEWPGVPEGLSAPHGYDGFILGPVPDIVSAWHSLARGVGI